MSKCAKDSGHYPCSATTKVLTISSGAAQEAERLVKDDRAEVGLVVVSSRTGLSATYRCHGRGSELECNINYIGYYAEAASI